MERIIYKNENGQSIEFSHFSPYILTQIKESVANNITSTKQAARDGEQYASSNLDARDISIMGCIKIGSETEALRDQFVKILNPKENAKLICYRENGTKEINVFLETLPELKRNGGTLDFAISLVALDPYWREIEQTEYLAFITKKLKFPLVIPSAGMIFGQKKSILETEVNNIGDVESGFRVIFKAKGAVRNVEIENKYTGEKLKILTEMQKDDVVEIINQPNRKMILLNGQKAFNKLDVENSRFFNLEVGKNLIGYNAELNAVNLEVILYYSPLYLGR